MTVLQEYVAVPHIAEVSMVLSKQSRHCSQTAPVLTALCNMRGNMHGMMHGMATALSLTLLVIICSQAADAQEIVVSPPAPASPQVVSPQVVVPAGSQPSSQSRTAAKPVVGASAEQKVDGATYVALDSTLNRIYNGWAPQSVDELKALESQQAKVAAAIQQVTVNVRQGPAQGSGVLISGNYVLTAAHVGGKPKRDAVVVLSDGTELKAKVLGMNRNVDAGLLQITDTKGKTLPYATLGKSKSLKPGHWVIGSGHPGGWQSGRGAVIRVGRVLEVLSDTLITDVALIGGDSGGPLFNLRGELIGIHSRIGTDVVDNMHVPIDTFAHDWNRLFKGEAWGVLPGYAPSIGVLGVEDDSRAIIGKLRKDGAAFKFGIQVGDIVRKFDGQEIQTFEDLQNAVRATLPGDTVKIEVQRGDRVLRFPITIGVAE